LGWEREVVASILQPKLIDFDLNSTKSSPSLDPSNSTPINININLNIMDAQDVARIKKGEMDLGVS